MFRFSSSQEDGMINGKWAKGKVSYGKSGFFAQDAAIKWPIQSLWTLVQTQAAQTSSATIAAEESF